MTRKGSDPGHPISDLHWFYDSHNNRKVDIVATLQAIGRTSLEIMDGKWAASSAEFRVKQALLKRGSSFGGKHVRKTAGEDLS